MKKILVITLGTVHPTWLARRNLKAILKGIPEIEMTTTSDINTLADPGLADYDGIITYFHRQDISPDALEGLESFVTEGGGFLGIHAATASFKGCPGYFDILGGKFTGHGSSREHIEVCQKKTGIFPEMPSFTVRDELYFHQEVQPVEVHFAAEKEGKDLPLVWTRNHGEGRVAYVMFGHRASVLKESSVQEIISTAVLWTAG